MEDLLSPRFVGILTASPTGPVKEVVVAQMAPKSAEAATAATTALRADECRVYLVRHGETDWNAEHRMQVSTFFKNSVEANHTAA